MCTQHLRQLALIGSLRSSLAFVLRQGAQECYEAATNGVVRSKCRLSSTLIVAPHAWVRSKMCTPSIVDLVARSHSATTSTSPVPSASIAFSSCGRPRFICDLRLAQFSLHPSERAYLPPWHSLAGQ